ncbi:MAG: glycosyltransferase [Aurantimonas endophytica]|uniref:glycosyltransferase n=1 Tax=Aurantimonas endophytica TaxID=1522175 RepID=UPI0030021789
MNERAIQPSTTSAPTTDALLALSNQMRADRATIARLRSEAAELRQTLREVEPLRHSGLALGLIRSIEGAQRRFGRANHIGRQVARWAANGTLREQFGFWRAYRATRLKRIADGPEGAEPPAEHSRDRPLAPVALVLDYQIPRPDRDAGSMYMIDLLDRLLRRGFSVHFAIEDEFEGDEPYRDSLRTMGVQINDASSGTDAARLIERLGEDLALCILTRVYGGGRHAEKVIDHCPAARVVFNTIDLHFVRVERQNALAPTEETALIARQTRDRECRIVALSDATIVVSTAEKEILADILPLSRVSVVPLIAGGDPVDTVPPFGERHHVGFVGGFRHQPNVDAVNYFLDRIWPLVREQVPEAKFEIVGADLPQNLINRTGKDGVRYLGHVRDLTGWLHTLRMTVAPLRFGAGAKGKVISSLAAGVPCVLTSVAAEGMGLHSNEALVADEPAEFAARIAELYHDPELWSALSEAGLANTRGAKDRADQAFDELLLGLGFSNNYALSGAHP